MREIRVIEDGALLIKDGAIEHVGPSRRLEKLADARAADVIDASGRVVIPGFVDCFTQLMCGPPRQHPEPEEALAASSRIFRSWSAQRLELEGRKRLRQFIRFGTTTLAASSGHALDNEVELRSLRAVDRLRNRPVELAPQLYTTALAWQTAGGSAWEFLEAMGTATLPAAHGKRLLSGVVLGSGFPDDAMDGYLACARRLGLTAFVETEGAAVELACRAGVEAVLDLRGIGADQMSALAGSNTAAILLPGRSFQCGRHGFAPARQLIDRGAAVALATGFDTLASPTASIPMVMALACTQMRMSPEEALTAVTVNAAHALGIGARTGALQYGMQADLLMMDCGDYREIPLYFGMNPVAMAMRRGETIFPRVETPPGD
jgi:imidazolonepropionase